MENALRQLYEKKVFLFRLPGDGHRPLYRSRDNSIAKAAAKAHVNLVLLSPYPFVREEE